MTSCAISYYWWICRELLFAIFRVSLKVNSWGKKWIKVFTINKHVLEIHRSCCLCDLFYFFYILLKGDGKILFCWDLWIIQDMDLRCSVCVCVCHCTRLPASTHTHTRLDAFCKNSSNCCLLCVESLPDSSSHPTPAPTPMLPWPAVGSGPLSPPWVSFFFSLFHLQLPSIVPAAWRFSFVLLSSSSRAEPRTLPLSRPSQHWRRPIVSSRPRVRSIYVIVRNDLSGSQTLADRRRGQKEDKNLQWRGTRPSRSRDGSFSLSLFGSSLPSTSFACKCTLRV